jgi:hypothetical protein
MSETTTDNLTPGEPSLGGPEECRSVPLDARQEAVALLLAAGRSVADAASETGAGVRTIRRWLAEDAAFRDRVQEMRTELFALAVGRLSNLSGKAADVLGQLLESQTEGIRLQAARSVLEQAPKLREATDLAAELARLKAQVEEATCGNVGTAERDRTGPAAAEPRAVAGRVRPAE